MKQSIFSTLLAIAISAVVVSCSSSDDYLSPLKNKTFSDITFDASLSTKIIPLGDEDLSKITARSSDGWCKVSVSGSSIAVSVDANDSYGERSATITLSDSEDGTTANFKVIQIQNDAILVDKNTYEVGEEGGVVEIGVQSNVSYNVDIIDADWITRASNTRGLEKSTIILNVAKNTSEDVREAKVKISNSSSGESSEIIIKQAFAPQFSIDKTSLNFDENGGEDEVTVISNLTLETSLSENWVEIASKDAKDDNTIVYKLKVKALGSDVRSRKADITFTNTKWSISEKVTITQTKSLYIDDSSVEIFVGDSYLLNFVNNIGGTVSWESSNTSVATVDSKGKVTGVSKGKTTITVTSADGKYSDEVSVSVIQSLSIQDSDFEIYVGETYSINIINKTAGSLSWKSSNTSVATVDNSGKVTGVGKGNATITVTSADGECSDNITVSVVDILDKLSCDFDMGWTSIVTSSGAFTGYFVSCSIKNNSNKNLSLAKCEVYKGGSYIDSQSFSKELKAGSTESVKLLSKSGINGSYTFIWYFTFNGKTYQYRCDSPVYTTY